MSKAGLIVMASLLPAIVVAFAIFISICYLITTTSRRKPPRLPLPPGPTPWPVIGNIPHLGPLPHHSTARLARQYGPLLYLRLGSVDAVVAASSSVVSQFLKTNDANFSNRPPSSAAKYIAYDFHDMVFGQYGPRWKLLRKICSLHLFSGKVLEDFWHVREDEAGKIVGELVRKGTVVTELFGHLYTCNANVIGRMVLGQRLIVGDGKSDARGRELLSILEEVRVVGGAFQIGDFIPWLHWLDPQGIKSRSKRLSKRSDRFLTEVVEERRKQPAEVTMTRNDLLSVMVLMRGCIDEDGKKLTDTEMKALLLNMFITGIETSSSIVEWTMAEIIKHPGIMSRLQDELDSVVGQDRLISESDLPSLTYFQAVIKEAFRLHPTTPLSVPRMAIDNCEINGYHIPKGATLMVNIWAIGRDPEVWSDPSVFIPERFMPGGEGADVDIKGASFEVMPFGGGRRICAGLSLGLRMTQLLVAALIHSFNWELPEGVRGSDLNMGESFEIILRLSPPLAVRPKPRLSSHVYKDL